MVKSPFVCGLLKRAVRIWSVVNVGNWYASWAAKFEIAGAANDVPVAVHPPVPGIVTSVAGA